MATQYITDEQDQHVGLILDWATYQKLVSPQVEDPELLPALGTEELSVLAHVNLSPNLQQELNRLLVRKKEEVLSESELGLLW